MANSAQTVAVMSMYVFLLIDPLQLATTKPSRCRAKVVLGQDKQKTYIILMVISFIFLPQYDVCSLASEPAGCKGPIRKTENYI